MYQAYAIPYEIKRHFNFLAFAAAGVKPEPRGWPGNATLRPISIAQEQRCIGKSMTNGASIQYEKGKIEQAFNLFLHDSLEQVLPSLFLPKRLHPSHMLPYHVNPIPSTVPCVHVQDMSICKLLCISCGCHHRSLYKTNHQSRTCYKIKLIA